MTDPSFFDATMFRQLAGVYGDIFAFDLQRYLIGAGGVFLLINVMLKRWLRGRKIRNKTPGGAQMRREAMISVRTVAIFALNGLVIYGLREAGVIRIQLDPSANGWGYFVFSVVALIILHDSWFYWTHRLIHDPRLFRRLHRTHHQSHNPSPWTAYSFDIGEAMINAAFLPLVLLFLPVSGLAIFVFLAHMMARNAIGHCGYEVFPARRNGRPLFDWSTSVTHHDLHHAQAGWNYGLYFTWWDRMMGTEHPLYHEKFAAAVRRPLDGSAVAAINARQIPDALIAATFFILSIAGVGATLSPTKARAEDGSGAQALTGVWVTQGHGAHVVFENCEHNQSALCARMAWTWDPELALRSDGYLLGDFIREGNIWKGGWLANPDDGKTYRGKMELTASGGIKIERLCAGVLPLSDLAADRRRAGMPSIANLSVFQQR